VTLNCYCERLISIKQLQQAEALSESLSSCLELLGSQSGFTNLLGASDDAANASECSWYLDMQVWRACCDQHKRSICCGARGGASLLSLRWC